MTCSPSEMHFGQTEYWLFLPSCPFIPASHFGPHLDLGLCSGCSQYKRVSNNSWSWNLQRELQIYSWCLMALQLPPQASYLHWIHPNTCFLHMYPEWRLLVGEWGTTLWCFRSFHISTFFKASFFQLSFVCLSFTLKNSFITDNFFLFIYFSLA